MTLHASPASLIDVKQIELQHAVETLSSTKIDDYRTMLRNGSPAPPIRIGQWLRGHHIIVDGHHRYQAALLEGHATVLAIQELP